MVQRRKQIGLTQQDLASLCGVSQNTISAVENEIYKPSFTLAYKITMVLAVTPEEIDWSQDTCLWQSMNLFFAEILDIADIQLEESVDKWGKKNAKNKC